MLYFMLARSLMLLLDLATILWHSEHEKDLEILLLRQQLRILQRKHPHPPRLSRCKKLGLAVLAARFMAASSNARSRLAQVVVVFKPDTLLKWHRELVRRKWAFTRRRTSGRPPVAPELEALLLRVLATYAIRSSLTHERMRYVARIAYLVLFIDLGRLALVRQYQTFSFGEMPV